MQTLPESTSCHFTRNLVTAVALVGFGVLSLAVLIQRRTVDRLETRIAVLEQQNLRLTASVQTLEEAARDDDDNDNGSAGDLIDPFTHEDSNDEVASDNEVEQLVVTAQQLYVQGQYELAATVVEPATRVTKTAGRAWRILGATACFLHDAKNAQRASSKLDASGQAFLRYVCYRNDVKL